MFWRFLCKIEAFFGILRIGMHPHPHDTPRDRRTERRRNAPLLMQRGEIQGDDSDGPILLDQKSRRSRSCTVVVLVGAVTPVDSV